jgi:predicted anti-sigma-YlaC factor YlaD
MATDDELTCQEFVELVTDYLENALLADKIKQIEEHLADCPGCDAYLEQIRQSIGLLRHLSSQPILPGTKQELLQVFLNWKQS